MQNSQENACARVYFLLKKKLWHKCFPVNFAKFLRISVLQLLLLAGALFLKIFDKRSVILLCWFSTQTLIQKLMSLVQTATDSNKCLKNSKTQIVLEKRLNTLFVSKRLKIWWTMSYQLISTQDINSWVRIYKKYYKNNTSY